MKFIFVTDPHFKADYNFRLDNVLNAFESKIEQVFELVRENDCSGILWGGDIFQAKNPNETPKWFLSWLINLLKKSPVPMWSNIGNHDVPYNDTSRINRQPLGILFAAGIFNYIESGTGVKIGPNCTLYSFDYGYEFDLSPLKIDKNVSECILAVLHHHLVKTGPGKYFSERAWGFNELERFNFDFVLNGHDHKPYSIEKYKNTSYIRPGGMFRTSRGLEDMVRPIQVALIDTDKKQAKYIELNHESSEKIFDKSSVVRANKLTTEVDNFIGKLDDSINIKKKTIKDEINKMNLDSEISERIDHYLSEVDNGK